MGGVAIDHKGLCAIQPEAVAGTHRLHPCLQRSMLGPFVDCERRKQGAVGYFRQMLEFLRGAATARQRGSREYGGGKKRRRHQGAADLLHHYAGFDATKTATAETFR